MTVDLGNGKGLTNDQARQALLEYRTAPFSDENPTAKCRFPQRHIGIIARRYGLSMTMAQTVCALAEIRGARHEYAE